MPSHSCVVEENIPPDLRLDRYVAEYLKLLSRSQIKARSLSARLNGKCIKISRILKAGDRLDLSWNDSQPADIIPEDLPLDIIYENDDLAVINKAQGMVVHPGAGNHSGTLANALLFRKRNLNSGEIFRPGIVHRLDKDTSGVIVVAYNDSTLKFLSDQFKSRLVKKTYTAIVSGTLPAQCGRIETRITRDERNRKKFTVSTEKGKTALTFYKVIRSWKNYSLLLLRPKTGRTHQLRVHLRCLGNPILGDPLYSAPDRNFPQASLMLHAKRLTILLPKERDKKTFKAPLPPRFKELIRKLDAQPRQTKHQPFR